MIEYVLNAIGSVASIVGVVWALTHKNTQKIVVALLVLVGILSATAGYISYQNYLFTNKQAEKLREIEEGHRLRAEASNEAATILRAFPSSTISSYPGQNKGLILSGVAFLEKYKALYPDTYTLVYNTVIQDVLRITEKTGGLDQNDRDVLLQNARAMKEMVRAVAKQKDS